jgi:TonB family protein
MSKWILIMSFLVTSVVAFTQQYGTLIISDLDDPTFQVEGVSVFLGGELLGKTNHVGSFQFQRKLKGTLTLYHPHYETKTVNVKMKSGQITETDLMMNQSMYDSLKAVTSAIIYARCLPANPESIYLTNENNPTFSAELEAYLQSVLNYPKRALLNNEKGTVRLRFAIEVDGSVSCIEIIQGATFELDKEAFRVVSTMPKWQPAKRNGVPVASLYTIPIAFPFE